MYNESKLAENKTGLNSVSINKLLCLSLIVLMILECILILLPVVEVNSSWLNQTWSFTLYDLLDDNMVVTAIVVLHIISVLVAVVPLVAKWDTLGLNYIAAYATVVLTFCINLLLAINVESLVTDTLLGVIASAASVDISLTVSLYCLLVVSIIGLVVSLGSMTTAGDKSK